MSVPVDRHVDPADHALDEISGGFGRRDPERVDDDGFLGAGVDRRLVRALEEVQLGA